MQVFTIIPEGGQIGKGLSAGEALAGYSWTLSMVCWTMDSIMSMVMAPGT